MSKKKKDWKTEKARLLSLELEERRKEYRRSDYVCLDKISTWRQGGKVSDDEDSEEKDRLSDKVSLYKGDITILEVDAIVNAANSSLLGGGGVDGCIHKAAGSCLYDECHTLNGCETGNAKITCGYDLPAKYVIHTVGPVARGHVSSTETSDLTACYQNCLKLVKENGLRAVAFPCISTGIYGFPNEPAADIALKTVKSWITVNNDKITRVIFCVFLETDFKIYKEKMSHIFQEDDVTKKVAEGQQREDNTPPSQNSRNKNLSADTDAGEDGPADDKQLKDEQTDPEDVEMENENPDTHSSDPEEANEEGEVNDNGPTTEDEQPAAERERKEEAGNPEHAAEREQTQTSSELEEDSKKEDGDSKDTGKSQDTMDVDGNESCTSSCEVKMEAQGKDSQGSDLTQTDSTQSKEPVDQQREGQSTSLDSQ